MRLGALGALAALGLLAAGCGGGSTSADDIAKAADKTAQVGSLEANFDISGQGIQGSGSGVFNTGKDRSGQSTMNLTARDSSGGLRQIPVDTVVTGDVFYMRSPAFAQATSQGKEWIKLDLAKLAQQRGVEVGGFLDASPTPTNALAYLGGTSEVKKVGTELVRSTKTTHYRVTSDLQRAADHASGSEQTALRRIVAQSGRKTLPLDVWVDGNGYIRKVNYLEHPGGQQAATVAMVLHDFGRPVAITPPPKGSVVDLMNALQPGG
jgi:hypothetical protein